MSDPEYPEDPPLDAADALINEGFQAYFAQIDEHGEADIAGLLAEPKYAAVADALRDAIEEDRRRPPPMMADTPTIPNPFGQYRLSRELGRGGMGVVYQAWERKSRLDVALKVLLPGQDRDRFEREVQNANRLYHENIIRILDPGIQDGPAYFSMELADGTLAGIAAELRDDPRRLAEVMLKVARAVHHAHQRGILHRDLKPGNVLMKEGVPKVADFGLAKRIGRPDPAQAVPRPGTPPGDTLPSLNGDTQSLPASGALGTRAGAILGTPEYMAPEQALADPSPTVSVDVHGLGAILYELLTGRPPFARGEGEGVYDVLERVIHQDPEPPRRSAPRTDPDLELICLKCMRKAPGERYATAAEVGDELARFLAHRPTSVNPRPWWERLRMWTRRDPLRAGLTGVITLMCVALLALTVWLIQGRIAAAESMAKKDRDHVEQQRYLLGIKEAVPLIFAALARPGTEEAAIALDRAAAAIRTCPPSLRGWEYHYLLREGHRREVWLVGHLLNVLTICFSNDGELVLTGSNDGTARLWSRASGKALAVLDPPDGPLHACFLADGKGAVTAPTGRDKPIRLWNLPHTGRSCKLWWPGDRAACDATPGGHLVTANPLDMSLRLYGQANGRFIRAVNARTTAAVTALAISRDGRHVAFCAYGSPPRLIDLAGDREIAMPPPGRFEQMYALAFSPDGRHLAVGSIEPALYRLPQKAGDTCERVKVFGSKGRQSPATLDFSPDGRLLAASYLDGIVRVWDVSSRRNVRSPRKHAGEVYGLAFSPDGRYLAVGRGSVVTIEPLSASPLAATHEPPRLLKLRGGVSALAFAGGSLVARGAAGGMLAWDVRDVRKGASPTWALPTAGGSSLQAEGMILRGDFGGQLRVWDADTGAPGAVGEGRLRAVTSSSAVVVGLRGEKEVVLLGAPDRTSRTAVAAENVLAIAAHPTRRAAAIGREDGVLYLQDFDGPPDAGPKQTHLDGHQSAIHALAFSADGRWLASGGDDRVVRVWDLTGKTPPRALVGHGGLIKGLAFSPDGRRLASCAQDNTVKVWDAEAGIDLITLTGDAPWTAVVFSPDGRLLAAGDEAGGVRLWDGTPLAPSE